MFHLTHFKTKKTKMPVTKTNRYDINFSVDGKEVFKCDVTATNPELAVRNGHAQWVDVKSHASCKVLASVMEHAHDGSKKMLGKKYSFEHKGPKHNMKINVTKKKKKSKKMSKKKTPTSKKATRSGRRSKK